MEMRMDLFRCAVGFCVTIFLMFGLLLGVSFLPQEPIDRHVFESSETLLGEGVYTCIADRSVGAQLDNFSEALILMGSKALTGNNLSYTLTNPIFTYWDGDPVSDLYYYAQDTEPNPSWFYCRYWMGFRTVIRTMLVFFDYNHIRQWLGMVFFLLFGILISKISRNVGGVYGVLFAVCVIAVKPYVIVNSMQYSCCFLIAFIAMLFVPWIHKHPTYKRLFFMEVGMVTMYFDFYTTPILTFGLPMIYLYLLDSREEKLSWKSILGLSGCWLAGYALTWIAKLALTEILTTLDALSSGFNSLMGWLGRSSGGLSDALPELYEKVTKPIAEDQAVQLLLAAIAAVMAALIGYRLLKREITLRSFGKHAGLLLIALFPVAWFICSARPMMNHYYFQYRGISVIIWAVGAYMLTVLSDVAGRLRESRDKRL